MLTVSDDFYTSSKVPNFLLHALTEIRSQYEKDLFRNGGCGVLASVLAAVCQQQGETCELSLIHRYDPYKNTDTLSHITLGLPDRGLSLDIDGIDADCRWVELIIDNEIIIYGYSQSEFSFQDILITPNSPHPLRHLQRVTEDYQLKTPVLPFYGQVLETALKDSFKQAA